MQKKIKNLDIKNPTKIAELLFYIFLLIALGEFVYLRGQDRNWDLLNYHFFQGWSLLKGHFLSDLAPANLQSFFNPIANFFAYLALEHLPFPFNSWSILLIQFTSIPAIILMAKEIGSGLGVPKTFASYLLAVILCLLSPLWISELGTTFFSSWTAPLVLWGVYFIYTAYQVESIFRNRITLAGLLFGLAIGIKLTNAPFGMAGFLMTLVLFYGNGKRNMGLSGVYFLIGCGIGFLSTSWWNYYLWTAWESPLFPLYNAVLKSKYFDLVNYQDMRWHFGSFQDFLIFDVQSFFGTAKTSEIFFADTRYFFHTLLIPASILCKPAKYLNRQIIAFLAFMVSAFILWVLMFAYQRYLIPIELLFGLSIWILVVRIVEKDWLRITMMISITICAALMLKIPDWGHAPKPWGDKNPFSIEMDAKLSDTPARYIVVGAPISYVLPSFHPNSLFYGIGFSNQVDNLIFKKLAEPDLLPLRILAKDDDASLIEEKLMRAGYDPLKHSLDCNYFRTGLGRYIVCEVQSQRYLWEDYSLTTSADFSSNGYLTAKGILWEHGLSSAEQWGSWSDGARIDFGLTNCLPHGKLRLKITGHAFGPNVDVPIKLFLGDMQSTMTFPATDIKRTVYFENSGGCINKLVIIVPRPTSPQELGESPDQRKLGIGLVNLEITKE